jgi:colicin import membrane protein
MKMAGAGSSAAGPGAAKAGGPSATYAGKVKAKVLPNVVFADEISGNPKAEVEVSTTSDGTIMSQRLTKSSGNKAWDDAVMKAIVRTGSLPRDIDGRVPTPMIIEFRPH